MSATSWIGLPPIVVRPTHVEPLPVDRQVCRMCGLRRGRGESDTSWVLDVQVAWRRNEAKRFIDGDGLEHVEVAERPAMRRHVTCIPSGAAVLAAVIALDLNEHDAREVLRRHGRSLLAGDRQAIVSKPWSFVTTKERNALRAIAADVVAPPEPAAHPAGRCGICGQSRSVEWATVPGLFWTATGRQAPCCSTCAAFVPLPGLDLDLDLLRIRAIGDLAGVRPSPSLRSHSYYGLKLAFEVLVGDEQHADVAGRWRYRETALATVAETVRSLRPELLLDTEERERRLQVLEARRAEAEIEARRRQTETAIGPDVSAWA